MAIFTKNKELDRIQLYLEREIANVRQEIREALRSRDPVNPNRNELSNRDFSAIGQGALLAVGAGGIGGSGIQSFTLLGSVLTITDTLDNDYNIDLAPILTRVESFSLTDNMLKLVTNSQEFVITIPTRDVIQGFELNGKTLTLDTDEEDYNVDLSSLTGTLSDFSITGRTISLTYEGTTSSVLVPDAELISGFDLTSRVLTLTTNRATYTATLPEQTADTIQSVTLTGTVLQITTDQKTHSLQLPSGGDTINNLRVNSSNVIVLETVRGNFTAQIPRQGDLIEGLRVVDGYLYLDIVGKDGFKVKLPVSTAVTPDPDPEDPTETPDVPTGRDTRSLVSALQTELGEIILVEDGQDFLVREDITGHVAGLPAGRPDAILTETGEVLITEEVIDLITVE